MITIGGSDPDNLSLRIVEALGSAQIPNLEIILVVGSSNPHLPALHAAVERSALSIKIEQNVSEMPVLMAWADVAISGAGGTSYELCYMGLPALLFIISENQRQVAAELSGFDAAIHAGWAGDFDGNKFVEELSTLIQSQETRQAISDRARSLVDGLGADRVRAALVDKQITVRRARADDCQLLFSWASDPATRSASFSRRNCFGTIIKSGFRRGCKTRRPSSISAMLRLEKRSARHGFSLRVAGLQYP